jgi:hypothetical protein
MDHQTSAVAHAGEVFTAASMTAPYHHRGQERTGHLPPKGAAARLEGLRRAACGAGPTLGVGPAITDHISSNDRDVP